MISLFTFGPNPEFNTLVERAEKPQISSKYGAIMLATMGGAFSIGSALAFKATTELEGDSRISMLQIGVLSLFLSTISWGAAAHELWCRNKEDVDYSGNVQDLSMVVIKDV